MMKRAFSIILVLLVSTVLAYGQDRPLSPPEVPPVPLSDKDQARARAEELARKAEQAKKDQSTPPVDKPAARVLIPQPHAARHILSGNVTVDAMAYQAAARYGLDPCLILSVMRAESAFNQGAVSPKGASGLMQLMPATAQRFGVKNIFDPQENISAGARYLRWLLDRFRGDLRLALAGYNAGEGAVEFYGYRIPPFSETQNYVRIIYGRYSRIHGDSQPAPAQLVAAPAEERLPTYNQIIRFTT